MALDLSINPQGSNLTRARMRQVGMAGEHEDRVFALDSAYTWPLAAPRADFTKEGGETTECVHANTEPCSSCLLWSLSDHAVTGH